MNTQTAKTLAFAMVLCGVSSAAERLAGGLEFQAPQGWTVKSNDQAAVIAPPDMVMERNEPAEVYIIALLAGVKDLQDKYFPAGTHVTEVGAARPFQAAGGSGYLHNYVAISQGVALRMQMYVVGLASGGTAGVLAIGRSDLVARRAAAVAAVAASISRTPASMPASPTAGSTASSLASDWDQRLRGKKLMQFSSYSSGYGSGGYSSETSLLLAADGSFAYRRSGSVAVYAGSASGTSASRNGYQGRWRIYEQAGRPLLELVSSNGNVETIVLTNQAGKTFLNNHRWLVGN